MRTDFEMALRHRDKLAGMKKQPVTIEANIGGVKHLK